MSGYDVQWEPGTFKVIAFIDDNVSRTCRPGGGPMEEGPDAPRYDNEIQAAFYNGWKNIMKSNGNASNYQTVAHLICMDQLVSVAVIWKFK